MFEFALVEGFNTEIDFSDGPQWLEALPARVYQTPNYGEVPVTKEKLQKMVDGFKSKIRGQDIAVNFDHGMDANKGNKAAGWYKDFAIRPSSSDPSQLSLYAAVEFTDTAQQEIKAGEWKYFSMEWDDLWMDNAGVKHEDVIMGGALTNRPVAKNMAALPVNFSEALWNDLDPETQKEFAVLTSAERSALPASAFLYKGHLPYRKADGSIDMIHLRNAISRLSQKATGTVDGESWLTDSVRSRLLAKARSLLAAHGKNMSEEVITAIEGDTLVLVDEVREWEHSEPGTGPTPQYGDAEQPDPGTGQPVPRVPGNPSDDPAIGGGWRREPLPEIPGVTDRSEGGSALTPEELAELKLKLGLKEDATPAEVIATAEKSFSESVSLREDLKSVDEEKRFAEAYPTMFAEQQALKAESRENKAKAFSESVVDITRTEGEKQVTTGRGLSALAKDKVTEVHKKFGEGTATQADFEDAISTIVHGGLVEYGEGGSAKNITDPPAVDTRSAEGIAVNRKLFAEKVREVQAANKELDTRGAMTEAAKLYPELAAAYSATSPA